MLVFMQPNVIDAIKSLIGKVVVIETAEGVTRRGKLTQVRTRAINVGVRTGEPREFVPAVRQTRSRDFNFPVEFILDNDAADPIPFATCSRLDVDGVAEKIDVVAELAANERKAAEEERAEEEQGKRDAVVIREFVEREAAKRAEVLYAERVERERVASGPTVAEPEPKASPKPEPKTSPVDDAFPDPPAAEGGKAEPATPKRRKA